MSRIVQLEELARRRRQTRVRARHRAQVLLAYLAVMVVVCAVVVWW